MEENNKGTEEIIEQDEKDISKPNTSKYIESANKLKFKNRISNLLIVVGIIIILTPIVGKIIAQKNQDAMLESFYLELESSNASQEDANSGLDESLAWGADQTNQEELAQNIEDVNEEEAKPKTLKKMPKPIGVITISSIDVKLPIAEGVDLETLKFAVGHMPGTAALGGVGNSVLAGHRSHTFGIFFNRLDEVIVGDQIIIEKADGSTTTYEVYKTLLVDPKDTSVLNTTSEHKVLTLITCHPEINPDSRLIVHAIEK